MNLVQRRCARVFFFASPVKAAAEPSALPSRGRRTPASPSPHAHACRVRILAPDTPPTGARAAVVLPRNRASRRQGHWPSPLPSTRLFAARSTSSRLCPALECPARLGCSRPRLENRSASLSPRRRPPLQCLCTTRRLTLSPPPTAFNPRPSSPLSYPRRTRKPPLSFLSLTSLCLVHLSQDSE